jgi:hypothetical protein
MGRRIAPALVALLNEWRSQRFRGENWKTAYIAEWMRVPHGYVDSLFSGTARDPSPHTLRSIADAFGVPQHVVFSAAGVKHLLTEEDALAEDEFDRLLDCLRSSHGGVESAPALLSDERMSSLSSSDKRIVVGMWESHYGQDCLWEMIDTRR